jgi:hypothetical protein
MTGCGLLVVVGMLRQLRVPNGKGESKKYRTRSILRPCQNQRFNAATAVSSFKSRGTGSRLSSCSSFKTQFRSFKTQPLDLTCLVACRHNRPRRLLNYSMSTCLTYL